MEKLHANSGAKRYELVTKSITLPIELVKLIEEDKHEFMTENFSEIIRLRLLAAYRQAGKLPGRSQ